jgi:hypothetical protein
MKKFLLVSFILLIIALLLVSAAFLYVSMQLDQGQSQVEGGPADEPTDQTTATPESATDEDTATPTLATDGIPLRDLPLNDSQRSALDTMGIDVETFVITPEIQACAAAKLGDARMSEIVAGGAPSLIETTKLISCL